MKMDQKHRELRVLVADDEPAIRRVVLRVLPSLPGFVVSSVAEAANGVELLAQLRSGSWDLVLTDLMMPLETGIGAVQQAIADGQLDLAETAVVFMTGNCPHAHLAWAKEQGIPVVAKPFDLDELLAVLARELSRLSGRQAS